MTELNAVSDLSTIRFLEPAVIPRRRDAVETEAPRDAANGTERGARDRYRVDAAYRAYQRSRAATPPPAASGGRPSVLRISSAELLDSMIHQMGGAHTSSAKGAFVDISI